MIGRTAKLDPRRALLHDLFFQLLHQRDLPMPASPLSNTTWPSPAFTRSQCRRSSPSSSSLPTRA